MYKVNDAVMYVSYGVCTISSIENRDFCGENVEYYVLHPVNDKKNTFYVPTSFGTLKDKMKSVCTKAEVDELINAMPENDRMWIDDDELRKKEFRRIIDSGDRSSIVSMIKILYLHRQELLQNHKRLHSTDERFLSEAENMLYDEFAYALEIPKDEVISYIKNHIPA